ncbi:hypothetical protein HPB49_023031 [Dermacentor silvarum]|uniref:Uncharacterized protein n=1 Tax=Dermacentor silvarum TaxID=543639 RepID=A0ACB8D086_DERSI|nr:hypothetical protein HPB49_023031 [Dermacentor silvarum]
MNTHSDIDAPTVSAVELKLAPVWSSDLELWFIQVQAQFAARRITAGLMRYHSHREQLAASYNQRGLRSASRPTCGEHVLNFEGDTHSTPHAI